LNDQFCPRVVPLALLEAFAEIWVELRGGNYRKLPVGSGTLVLWQNADGSEFGLPDRMYGLADYASQEFTYDLPERCCVNLPPGVGTPDGVSLYETHVMHAQKVEDAWNCLKRVGRQGVRKAETSGCTAVSIQDEDYFLLSERKNERLGSPPQPSQLVQLLRRHLGVQNVGITGVEYEGTAVASVLWTVIDGYGLLIDGASDPKHWDKNPNNLAVWTAIEAVLNCGADVIDFGFSPAGSGDGLFKKHMGGTCVPLFQIG